MGGFDGGNLQVQGGGTARREFSKRRLSPSANGRVGGLEVAGCGFQGCEVRGARCEVRGLRCEVQISGCRRTGLLKCRRARRKRALGGGLDPGALIRRRTERGKKPWSFSLICKATDPCLFIPPLLYALFVLLTFPILPGYGVQHPHLWWFQGFGEPRLTGFISLGPAPSRLTGNRDDRQRSSSPVPGINSFFFILFPQQSSRNAKQT